MKIKKSYSFLYMPEDHGPMRRVHVPRGLILGAMGLVFCLAVGTGLYLVGVGTGSGWLPGGSRLQRENTLLQGRLGDLEVMVAGLQEEMDRAFDTRDVLATAVNLRPLDDETYAAGIGGRGLDMPTELPEDLELRDPAAGFDDLGERIDLLVRQARIQRLGFEAMLDTLSGREAMRARIPSIRPVDVGWVSSRYGRRTDPFTKRDKFHRGLDFSTPTGTAVRATGDGVISMVQQQRGLGKVVKIDHGNGVVTVYAHLDAFQVKKGDKVTRGQVIANSGNSGRSTAPHLHYEVHVDGRAVNPLPYILDSYAGRH